jgi:serine/threonine protein phosphatase PrpC
VTWGVLRGRDQTALAQVAALGEGEAAVALSRGGAPKRYRHREPNEDCAGFRRGPGGVLLAVADAHEGCAASELALDALLLACGEDWTAEAAPALPWPELAGRAAAAAHRAVLARAAGGGEAGSRSTLAFALARPAQGLLAWASLGDSHVFLAGAQGAEELGPGRDDATWFIGAPQRTPEEIAARLRSGSRALGAARALVLATDGLSERGIGVAEPAAAVAAAAARAARAAPDLRALEAARALVELALESHQKHRAGDNVAAAVAWLG